MGDERYEVGMIGLGVMGRNLVLNMADHGHSVVGYDRDPSQVAALQQAVQASHRVVGASTLEEFVEKLASPRAIMMMVPAGPPVDAVIRELLPYLQAGDLLIDGGNSYFKDTDLRSQALASKGILYLGVGISGGEEGARHGPSLMPGGPREGYERVRPLFEAIAAKVHGEPCVAYLGPGSAGHYVKMVHNGIEYGLMQLIAETYDVMKRGLNLDDDALHAIYARWNQTELQSYLLEITAQIFRKVDPHTGKRLIDVILDEAAQKGTGMWTSQSALELQVPTPTIDLAVAMRNLSTYKSERTAIARLVNGPSPHFSGEPSLLIQQLSGALYAGMILTYAQGMALLYHASAVYQYGLNLEAVARIWRGGCIIRAALLEEIRAAYQGRQAPSHLLLNPQLARAVMDRQEDLRNVIHVAVELGLPVPGFMASLAYWDAYRSEWLPANLIQAQRDYFGAHTYERIDEKGVFHTRWEEA